VLQVSGKAKHNKVAGAVGSAASAGFNPAAEAAVPGAASASASFGSAVVAAAGTANAPFFSIVMPMYGSEAYIANALFDVQSQIFGNWELIVVDDASPDGGRTIVEQAVAADSRIHLETHPQNRGLAAARNTGLAAARGEYVWFPDPDDRYDFTLLQSVYNSLAQQQAPVVMFGHVDEFYNPTAQLANTVDYALETHHYGRAKLRSHVLGYEKGTHYGYAWNKVYQRSYLREGGFQFTEDLPLIEDIEFNVRVFQNLPALNVVGETLYRYAKREQANLTNKFVPRYYEVHRQRIEMLRNQLESWGLLSEEAKATLGALYSRYILSALERNAQKESGMNGAQQREWLEGVFADALFDELVPCAKSESRAVAMCLRPLQQRNVAKSLTLGKFIHAAKGGALHNVFMRLKTQR
jgi:glycosyltransferase involved in cell wall biosynthesis